MWGNALGWTISLVIVVATAAGIVFLERHLANLTPATDFGRDPANLASIELPAAPRQVAALTDACDAGPIYRRAIDAVNLNRDRYASFAEGARAGDEAASLAALELLVSATDCAQMSLFTANPEQVVCYGRKPELEALLLAGKCAIRLGLLRDREQRHAEAMKHYRAAFALGAHLHAERLVLDQLLAGLELMSAAAGAMAASPLASGEAEALKAFRARNARYQVERIQPLQRVIGSIDAGVIERHSGDVFHIARHARERMWRVEAILKIGRLRFNAARVADQQGANRLLQRLSEDPDPVLRAAAMAARSLTIEQYRML